MRKSEQNNEMLCVEVNQLLDAIAFQKKHDRFYEYYLGEDTDQAIIGLLKMGLVKGYIVRRRTER